MYRKIIISGIVVLICLLSGCSFLQKPAPKPKEEHARDGVTVDGVAVGDLSAEEITKAVLQLAQIRNHNAVNAGFTADSTVIVPEQSGAAVDVEATVQNVLSAPPDTAAKLVIVQINPVITVNMLQKATLIGTAATPLLDQGNDRVYNIKKAAHAITNTTVTPGGIFSFNTVIGNPTRERGYRAAPIIEEGEKVLGWGGGVCQISSTLYNAALTAKLPITERHPHSKPVDYIAEGRDATTSDDKDFKFRNNRQKVLIFRVVVIEDLVKTDIWELP
jgi:vancomycin resistance protein YoaR